MFLEEKIINNLKIGNNIKKNEGNSFNRKNNEDLKLIKVCPFDIEICDKENDYLLHAEISPKENYICFLNKKYPKYLFFANFHQSDFFLE